MAPPREAPETPAPSGSGLRRHAGSVFGWVVWGFVSVATVVLMLGAAALALIGSPTITMVFAGILIYAAVMRRCRRKPGSRQERT